jgi:hypothetical protein
MIKISIQFYDKLLKFFPLKYFHRGFTPFYWGFGWGLWGILGVTVNVCVICMCMCML